MEHVKHQEAILGGLNRRQRNLGNSDITKLLDDLDNETEAIKSGQEIGEELLSAKIQTKKGDEKLYQANDSFSQGWLKILNAVNSKETGTAGDAETNHFSDK